MQTGDGRWRSDWQRAAAEFAGAVPFQHEGGSPKARFAYQQRVTQILVGESLRLRWQEFLPGSFANRLIQRASHIDIHVLAQRKR